MKASARDSYKADPEKKKASVRDSYKTPLKYILRPHIRSNYHLQLGRTANDNHLIRFEYSLIVPCIGLYLQLLWQCVGKDMRKSRFLGCIKLHRYKSGDSLKRESPNEY